MTDNYRSKNIEYIIDILQKEVEEQDDYLFRGVVAEKLTALLSEESRFSKLVKWIDDELEEKRTIAECFNPYRRFDGYTVGYFNNYKSAMGEIAMLLQFRDMLLDSRCTEEERKNIEYTICRVYGIGFIPKLNCYGDMNYESTDTERK